MANMPIWVSIVVIGLIIGILYECNLLLTRGRKTPPWIWGAIYTTLPTFFLYATLVGAICLFLTVVGGLLWNKSERTKEPERTTLVSQTPSTAPVPSAPTEIALRNEPLPQKQPVDKNAALKAMQPSIRELIPLVEAYAVMLEGLSRNSQSIIDSLTTAVNSPGVRETYSQNPRAMQELTNKHASDLYEVHRRMVRTFLEKSQDERLPSRLAAVSSSIRNQPGSDTKTVLTRITGDCLEAEEKVRTLQSRRRSDLADMMRQIKETPGEVDNLAANLRSYLDLLRTTDTAIDRQ
jgi:hypothetical protein